MTYVKPRPWYVLDGLCDNYLYLHENGGDLRMLQALKVIRGITLNVIIAAISVFTILEGADPTLIGGIGLIGLMLINGIELSDYLAAKQALDEAQEVDRNERQ